MEDLKQFNPKLYNQIKDDPNSLLTLQSLVYEHEKAADAAAVAEALTAVAENYQHKPPKVYSLPFIWAWGAPVFTATASALVSLQAGCGIPWMSFIILCGFGVRLLLAPLMLRQMTLINKISQASPNIRMAAKLFKFSDLPLHKRIWHTARAMLDYSK